MNERLNWHRHSERIIGLRQLWEFQLAIALIVALPVLAIPYYMEDALKAEFSEAGLMMQDALVAEMEHFALTGDWLPSQTMTMIDTDGETVTQHGRFVERIDVVDGTIGLRFKPSGVVPVLAGERVGFRLALPVHRPADTVLRLCGPEPPPEGWATNAPDLTSDKAPYQWVHLTCHF